MSAELENRKQKVLGLAEQNRRLVQENSVLKAELSRGRGGAGQSRYVQTEAGGALMGLAEIPPIGPPRASTQELPGLTAPSGTERGHEGLDSLFTQSTHLL